MRNLFLSLLAKEAIFMHIFLIFSSTTCVLILCTYVCREHVPSYLHYFQLSLRTKKIKKRSVIRRVPSPTTHSAGVLMLRYATASSRPRRPYVHMCRTSTFYPKLPFLKFHIPFYFQHHTMTTTPL